MVKASRLRSVWVAVGAIALLGAACSNAATSGTTTTSAPGSNNSTTSSPGSSSSSTTSSTAQGSSISSISDHLSSGQAATFLATYSFSATSSGKTESGTLTLGHSGADFLFGVKLSSGLFEEIETSSGTVVCTRNAGKWLCFGGAESKEFSGSLDPLLSLYDPKDESADLKADEASAYDVTSSSTTVAGQSASCITYHAHTDSGVFTICVTSGGELASLNGSDTSGTWKATLTSLSTSVPSSTFTPPAAVTSA